MRHAAALLTIASLASCFYSSRTSLKQIERRALHAAEPAPLEASKPWTKDPRKLEVRVLVDEDFRSQNLRWSKQIEEQLDDANQFLIPALGLELKVAEYRKWDVRTADKTMEEVLGELEAHDDGEDVAWVIAYVSSLSIAADSFEQLGVARALGKHIVVRGYADVGERRAFTEAFPRTTAEERERVHQARRRHKQTVVLIHELGHTLGAIHETDPGWIMHGSYGPQMSQFSDRGRELMQMALEEKLKPEKEQDVRALAGRMVGFLDANPWGGWVDDDRAQLLQFLRAAMLSEPAGGGGGNDSMAAPDIPVPPAASDQFLRAQALARQGKSAEALAELEALVAAYPGTAEIRQAICEVHIGASGPGSPAATTACDRAAEVSPEDARPYLARVEAYLRGGDQPHALEMLARAEARAQGPAWERIAAIYQAAGSVTKAEAAAKKSAAGDKHPVIAWATRTRARYGLPPDGKKFKIVPDDEGAYVAAVRELLDLIYAGKTGPAQVKARAAEKRWPRAPGILAARCDLQLRLGDKGGAKRLCAQAVAAWPGAAWAHYLEGVIALQEHKDGRAVAALRAAITADPELSQAYRALGKALSRTKDDAGWAALATEYQQRFGQALPR